nr:hypothetical protein [uncultured Vibrio sp.]
MTTEQKQPLADMRGCKSLHEYAVMLEREVEKLTNGNIRPVVDWQSPEATPNVPKGETKTFWLAILRKRRDGSQAVMVLDAQYVNKPLEYAEDDIAKECPLDDECFVSEDGDPIESVGWHCLMEHADFDGYYRPISFDENYELLGWGEYITPDFTGV